MEKSSCFLCGYEIKRQLGFNPTAFLDKKNREILKSLTKSWSSSLCVLLDVTDKKLQYILEKMPYCLDCHELISDIDFIMSTISRLETKLSKVKKQVKGLLRQSCAKNSHRNFIEQIISSENLSGQPNETNSRPNLENTPLQSEEIFAVDQNSVANDFENDFDNWTPEGRPNTEDSPTPINFTENERKSVLVPKNLGLGTKPRTSRGQEYVCPSCPPGSTSFTNKKVFHRHIANLHRKRAKTAQAKVLTVPRTPRGQEYVCPSCPPGSTRFTNKKVFHRHIANLHRKRAKYAQAQVLTVPRTPRGQEYVCPSCPPGSTPFTNKKVLNRHIANSHRKRAKSAQAQVLTVSRTPRGQEYVCPSCPLGSTPFTNKKVFKCHMANSHRRIKNPAQAQVLPVPGFSCPVCEKRYTCEEDMKIHSILHDSELEHPFSCVLCPNISSNVVDLRRHVLANHDEGLRYKCDQCPAMRATEQSLASHKKRAHLVGVQKMHQCPQCPFQGMFKSILRIHLQSHGDPLFKCEINNCSKSFRVKSVLKMHQRRCHETNSATFPCHLCSRIFITAGLLKGYQMHHSNLRPLMCEICSATFKTRRGLRWHWLVHNKIGGTNVKLQRPRKGRLVDKRLMDKIDAQIGLDARKSCNEAQNLCAEVETDLQESDTPR